MAPPPITPGAQFTLQSDTRTDKIALAPHVDGLSDGQLGALRALAARRAETGGGPVTISLPHGAADAAAAGRSADATQTVLNLAGAAVQRTTYESDDPKAPVLVSFDYEKAEIPKCGKWDDLTKTKENQVYSNFGCAVTANMAAQIANPEDLVHPHSTDGADVGRRMTVLDNYRKGEPTATKEPDQKGSKIAHVGQ
jgi:pilus assembly protein CpaD